MYKHSLIGLLTVLVILVAACGGPAPTATPEPSNTPAPTDIPAPTNTPVPTVDAASLPAADIEATIVALEAELEELHAGAAAAGEAAEGDIASRALYLEKDIEAARTALETALAREGGAGGMAEEAAAPVLTLTGDFAEAKDWGWADLEGLEMITATVAGPKDDDPEAEYTGVSLVALLEAAGPGEDAATLVATAADGFEAEIDVAALKDCAECMLVLEDGSLRLVLPGFASKAWVRDLVSLDAK